MVSCSGFVGRQVSLSHAPAVVPPPERSRVVSERVYEAGRLFWKSSSELKVNVPR